MTYFPRRGLQKLSKEMSPREHKNNFLRKNVEANGPESIKSPLRDVIAMTLRNIRNIEEMVLQDENRLPLMQRTALTYSEMLDKVVTAEFAKSPELASPNIIDTWFKLEKLAALRTIQQSGREQVAEVLKDNVSSRIEAK